MKQWSLDVEADGPVPGMYSMVSFGIMDVWDPSQSFYAEIRPISDQYVPEALKVSGFTREQTLTFKEPLVVMKEFRHWIDMQVGSSRPVIWSDNPGFDWAFLNYYMHAFLGGNSLGWSCRRIGDFASGLAKDPKKGSDWKRLRKTRHSHNALDDAKGNADALRVLFRQAQELGAGVKKPVSP